jgi:hypothetical protein
MFIEVIEPEFVVTSKVAFVPLCIPPYVLTPV